MRQQNKCYAEPDSTRKTVKTEGVAKGIAFVGKRATEGETEKDCTGKSDGDKVDVSVNGALPICVPPGPTQALSHAHPPTSILLPQATYVAFYLWQVQWPNARLHG